MRAKTAPRWWRRSHLALHAGLTRRERRRWDRANLIFFFAMMLVASILIALGAFSSVDLILADRAFDPLIADFPLRHAWWTERLNHIILKRSFIALALGFIGAACWDLVSARPWSRLRQFQIRVIALSALLVPAIIGILKMSSSSHCPWDIERYGGSEPYVRLLQALPAGLEAGHCMPAGHASSALWMISLAIFLVPKRLGEAVIAYGMLLAIGFAVGWVQQLRGAHFLTHTLWSMWLASMMVFSIVTVMDRWFLRRKNIFARPVMT